MIAFAWGRWTRYDSFHSSYLISTFIAFCLSSFLGGRLTRPGLGSVRNSTTTSLDSVDVCKDLYTTNCQLVLRMKLLDIKVHKGKFPPYLCNKLAHSCRPIHPISGEPGHQGGHEK